MTTDAIDPTEKRKKRPRRRRGCIILLVIVLLSPALCYGAMWLFARFGGEWATAGDLPARVGSQFITATYDDGYYTQKHSLYIYPSTPEELREWFIQAGIGMTPILLDRERNSYIDNPDYYMQPPLFHMRTTFQEIHQRAVYLTSRWWDDFMPNCQGIRVYKNNAAAIRDFPGSTVPAGLTAFVITTCWPDVN